MPTSYAADIHPLFRPKDISCVAQKGVMLGDADWMCDASGNDEFNDHANARRVFAVLSGGAMPPDGPWPEAKLDTYGLWMQDGFIK